jgi:hypothetical protein
MKKKPILKLWLDDYGTMVYARTVKELKEKVGPGRVFKIYYDRLDGTVVHCGYGVGKRWFRWFVPLDVVVDKA